MSLVLAGLGPAGWGLLAAMDVAGVLPEVVDHGLTVIDPSPTPGGGALHEYNVRSDSAAIVFAQCVEALRDAPELAGSRALARILDLPDGESVALPVVGELIREGTAATLRRVADLGADLRLGSRLTAVDAHQAGGATVSVTDWAGHVTRIAATEVVLALGGEPYVPADVAAVLPDGYAHSDALLRPAGLASALEVLATLPVDPRIVIVGRAHSAFSVADRLLCSDAAQAWGSSSVVVAARGQVRVTYPDLDAALADGAMATYDDVCPSSGRVWRLCGLRGDSARRYRLSRDGEDPRLRVAQASSADLAALVRDAHLVIAATGYRSRALRFFEDGSEAMPDGTIRLPSGRSVRGIRTIGLGSGSRRVESAGGEPSYTGPVDGVWHYQAVLAPPMIEALRCMSRADERRLAAV